MSIELENPTTLLGKVDAAANFVAQIRLAVMVGDKAKTMSAIEQAERLLFNATNCLGELPGDWHTDSSLETWFPLTAETHAARERKIKELEADRDRWKEMKWQDALLRPDELVQECDRIKAQFLDMEEHAVEQMDRIKALEDERRAVASQVNHLLNLEGTYKAVCEQRENIPFKWGPQPERDLLQERADKLAGEIMRTERRTIEGLKASASERAAGARSITAPTAEEKYNHHMHNTDTTCRRCPGPLAGLRLK